LEPGAIVKLNRTEDEREVLCVSCAKLDHLEFLPSGNTKLTQRAKRLSAEVFVVVRWSELWKTYERQGLLLKPEAIDKAAEELNLQLANRTKLGG
jgi:hypothetical protein